MELFFEKPPRGGKIVFNRSHVLKLPPGENKKKHVKMSEIGFFGLDFFSSQTVCHLPSAFVLAVKPIYDEFCLITLILCGKVPSTLVQERADSHFAIKNPILK